MSKLILCVCVCVLSKKEEGVVERKVPSKAGDPLWSSQLSSATT